jgi:hypothetical protein
MTIKEIFAVCLLIAGTFAAATAFIQNDGFAGLVLATLITN